jgi:TonB-dependent SusC/RagA subfamily outer membrane receptor
MKQLFSLLALILVISLSGCFATQKTTNSEKTNVNPSVKTNASLLDQLRASPGLIIRGNGENAQIFMRGISSINNPKEVLFIIDGSMVGNFSRAAFSVNPQNIKRIEVLKNPADIASYGFNGSGGVVLITTE